MTRVSNVSKYRDADRNVLGDAVTTVGSLFSGIGGLELGLEMCGVGPVLWQAECDPYALAVLEHHWPAVKRYNDVREIDERAERPDIICGGFPCQDVSPAGTRDGIDGARSGLWTEFARILRVLRPAVAFVENSSGLAARGMGRVLGDLAEIGFDAEWTMLRAADVGAPQLRERVFILAHTYGDGRERIAGWLRAGGRAGAADARQTDVADADGGRREVERLAQSPGLAGERWREPDGRGSVRYEHRFPPGPDEIARWTGAQPAVRRGADGLSGRTHRLRCLGNACVPQQAALAWQTLTARLP